MTGEQQGPGTRDNSHVMHRKKTLHRRDLSRHIAHTCAQHWLLFASRPQHELRSLMCMNMGPGWSTSPSLCLPSTFSLPDAAAATCPPALVRRGAAPAWHPNHLPRMNLCLFSLSLDVIQGYLSIEFTQLPVPSGCAPPPQTIKTSRKRGQFTS